MDHEPIPNSGPSVDPEQRGSSGNDNESAEETGREAQPLSTDSSSSLSPPKGKGGGPRTELGKARSRRNATTHGLFSKDIVLQGESKTEYRKLLHALRSAFHPESELLDVLLQQAANLIWRKRRLLSVERAGIDKDREFMEWDENERNYLANRIRRSDSPLINRIDTPASIERCISLLSKVKKSVEEHGFGAPFDIHLLTEIYGQHEEFHEPLGDNLYDWYVVWQWGFKRSEEERVKGNCLGPQQCIDGFIQQVDKEIRFLKRYQRQSAPIERRRTQLERVIRSLPDADIFDRLLRYDRRFSRDLERLLREYERVQRMLRGQPEPPHTEEASNDQDPSAAS